MKNDQASFRAQHPKHVQHAHDRLTAQGARPVEDLTLELHEQSVDLAELSKGADFINNPGGARMALQAKIPPGEPFIERIEFGGLGEQPLIQRIADDGTAVGDPTDWQGAPPITGKQYDEAVARELAKAVG